MTGWTASSRNSSMPGLILILMNHIGEPEVIREAIARARASLDR